MRIKIYLSESFRSNKVIPYLNMFLKQEGDDGNMVYVNEKGKLEVSREGKVLSVMPPGNRKLILIVVKSTISLKWNS